jgi:hypothetical protein
MGTGRHAPAALPSVKRAVPTILEAMGAPDPVCTAAETLAPTRVRSPDHPAYSVSLYRLIYPGHCQCQLRHVYEYSADIDLAILTF